MKNGSGFFKVMFKIMKLAYFYKFRLAFLISTLLVSSFLAAYPIKYIEKVINVSTSLEADKGSLFLRIGAIYLILQIMNIVFNALFQYTNSNLEILLGHKIRIDLFHKIQRLPVKFFENNSSSDLMIRLVQDSGITVDGILKPITFLVKSILVFGFGFYYMYTIDPQITLGMIPIGIILSLFVIKTGPRLQLMSEEEREKTTFLWDKYTEGIKGIKEIKANTQENYFLSLIIGFSKNLCDILKRRNLYSITTSNVNNAFFMSIIALIMVYGGYKVSIGTLTIGGLSAIMMYNGLIIDPMLDFFNLYQEMQRVVIRADKIFEIMDKEEEMNLGGDCENKNINLVEVKNLSFKHNDEYILRDICLKVAKGEKIVFVGQSGSGKSTLCKVLSTMYGINEGQIKINGINFEEFGLHALRKKIGIVFQENYIFSGTIKYNILFSKPDATEEELLKAIDIAQLKDFICSLKDGIDTEVGENGVRLSGGEKQRIAIARALVKNSDYLILDEATSALDPITTSKIVKNILEFYKEKTIIFTAHKLTNISAFCDCIYVMEKGRIMEFGTHEDLLSRSNKYKELYYAQFTENEGGRL